MTFNEFLEKAKKAGVNIDMSKQPGSPIISVHWTIGGVSGGNCWGEGGHYAVEGEAEPEFESFENLVLYFVPNISFADFNKLKQKVMYTRTWTENEYYGNSTSYAEKYAYLKDIYKHLEV